MKKMQFAMCVMMTEILTIDNGQRDALLRRANIKKIISLEQQFLKSQKLGIVAWLQTCHSNPGNGWESNG